MDLIRLIVSLQKMILRPLIPQCTLISIPSAMATVTPLTASPLRGHLLHRRRGRLHAKQHPHPQRRLTRTARLHCVPDGGGAEVSAPPASAAVEEEAPQERPEDFMLLASNRSDFNEIIMVIDSPVARYLVLDHNSTYWWLLVAYSYSV